MIGRPAVANDADEVALIERVAAKDRAAFDQLYRIYRPRLKRFVTSVVSNCEFADDVINEVMFAVWKDASRFNGASKPSTWIFAIAYRKALKTVQTESRRRTLLEEADVADPEPSLDVIPEHLVVRAWLERALKTLSPDQAMAVELTFFHGYSYQEIAEVADCSVNTVKTRMFYARRKLKDALSVN
ncbi:MAG: RNA polymerase sigma factor [Gammaproteobacteria bacterium]|nr:RNA polymerase sigma factor [Gammaproteobacteria bacterium]